MKRISLHGGHSGQFCDHARDSLAEIVAAYHAAGFECVGLTEHMSPLSDAWLYPDEVELGRTAVWMQERFGQYVAEARRLEREYAGRMRILVGMESEWYPGCGPWVAELRERFALDYVVGSVHHVGGGCFDFSKADYERIAMKSGGIVSMYAAYFDAQLAMMQELGPELVGHFDLIRLHDPNYPETLAGPDIWRRVERNLECVRDMGAILDVNARALMKGQTEPYVCRLILDAAAAMDIAAAYGDDAHGVTDVGCHVDEIETMLVARGMKGAELPRG
ncbi:histidinol-phosphatase [Desulfomicrobium salsuginis]